jgi:hypothetical protein
MMLGLNPKGQSTNLPDLRDCQNCSAFKYASGQTGSRETARDRRLAFDSYTRKRDPRRKLGPYLAKDEEQNMRTENGEKSESAWVRLQRKIGETLSGPDLEEPGGEN